MIYNSSNLVWTFWAYIWLFLVYNLSWYFDKFKSCAKLRKWAHNSLFWNGLIIFFLETYLDFTLVSILNVISYA